MKTFAEYHVLKQILKMPISGHQEKAPSPLIEKGLRGEAILPALRTFPSKPLFCRKKFICRKKRAPLQKHVFHRCFSRE